MCLYVKNKLTVKILKKNKTVYKILYKINDRYRSPYYPANWYLSSSNAVPPSQMLQSIYSYSDDFGFTVNHGLHAYTDKKTAKSDMDLMYPCGTDELVIAKMEIPAGSMIIEGENNEIVATKMKLIKII